jgi:hypothetical protein
VPGLCIVAVVGAGVEPAAPEGCAAKAEPAIKLVASSAAANFVNIVFSFLMAPGATANQKASAPIVEERLTPRALNAV